MILLGLILLALGFALTIKILWILGIVALACGLFLAILGLIGHGVAGRRHYY